jgi:hypothetical protein
MPISKKGKKVMHSMMDMYKDKEKAKSVFYASINMDKPGTEMWEDHDNSPIARYSKKRKK